MWPEAMGHTLAAQGDKSGVFGAEAPLQHETECACLATGRVLRATGA